MAINLKAVAEQRVNDPMSTWPDHTNCHRRTLMGDFLQDWHCLRCWLEEVATEKAVEAKSQGVGGGEQ